MSSLELLCLIYRSPLQGHLINRTRKQRLSKCLIRKQKRYSDLSGTTNTSLHYLTSHDAHEVCICVTATFHIVAAELNSSNVPSFGNTSISWLVSSILMSCSLLRGVLLYLLLCVFLNMCTKMLITNKFSITSIPPSGESLIHLYSHVPLHQLVKMLSQAGLRSFRHSVILRHCSAAKRHLD